MNELRLLALNKRWYLFFNGPCDPPTLSRTSSDMQSIDCDYGYTTILDLDYRFLKLISTHVVRSCGTCYYARGAELLIWRHLANGSTRYGVISWSIYYEVSPWVSIHLSISAHLCVVSIHLWAVAAMASLITIQEQGMAEARRRGTHNTWAWGDGPCAGGWGTGDGLVGLFGIAGEGIHLKYSKNEPKSPNRVKSENVQLKSLHKPKYFYTCMHVVMATICDSFLCFIVCGMLCNCLSVYVSL